MGFGRPLSTGRAGDSRFFARARDFDDPFSAVRATSPTINRFSTTAPRRDAMLRSRLVSVSGSPRFAALAARLALAPCGLALLIAGCSGYSSGNPDAGAGGKGGGSGAVGTGGKTGAGGLVGSGGMGTGGLTGTGGMGTGGGVVGTGGAMDAGTDTIINICADAGSEGGPGDSDLDGVPDCLDGCPMDYSKTAPGVCGCGVPDLDDDNDGVLNCLDQCPGIPDVDTDHDGVLDCMDVCPKDGTRTTTAGVCGCGGIPDTTPLCLVHRYSFNDVNTATVADSITIPGISPANGTALGTMAAGGLITLAGGASNQIGAQYVSLPGGTISSVGNSATFESWVTWNPVAPTTSGPWQRVFDFGSSDQPTGTPGTGITYLFLTPSNGATNVARTAITLASGGASEDVVNATGSLPTNSAVPLHLAVVVDGATKTLSLYINGVPNGTPVAIRPETTLSSLKDVNNWLGRSQWAADQLFAGQIHEFRIYSTALTASQISASFNAGPDTLPSPSDGGTTDASGADGGTGDAPADAPGGDAPADAASGQ
jgi:hypothetical protein